MGEVEDARLWLQVLHVDSAMRTTLRWAAFSIVTSVSIRSYGMYSS
jgi:hypothetical protein